jgi:hypothetical protein
MNTEETQAMKRLLKKLSALRATLSDDERALLDGFIVTSKADEVVAHVIKDAVSPAVTPAADDVVAHVIKDAVSPAVAPAADDVTAHVIKDAVSPAVAPAADDVAAHVIKEGISPVVAPATQPRPHPRFEVIYDPVKQLYKIA